MAESARIHIDLTEDLENEVIKIYGEMTEALKDALREAKSSLGDLCEKTHYEPMVNVVNETLSRFREEVRGTATKIFEEWKDGNASFRAAAEHSQAGEAARETAENIDGKIEGFFDDFWDGELFEEIGRIDVSRPTVTNEDFDTLEEIYRKASEQVKEAGEQPVKQIRDKGGDNPTYLLAVPPVEALTETLKKAFEAFTDKVKEFKEESQERTNEQIKNSEDMAQGALESAASMSEVTESMEFLKDI